MVRIYGFVNLLKLKITGNNGYKTTLNLNKIQPFNI